MNRFLSWLASLRLIVSPRWINDTFGVIGLGLVAWGVGLMHPPLAPVIVGVVFMTLAIIGALSRRKGRNDP